MTHFSEQTLNNLSVGAYSLQNLTSSNYNTAVGVYSLHLQTTGDNNTALGHGALENLQSGVSNTAIGAESVDDSGITYNECTFLGHNTEGTGTTSFSNNTAIGSGAEFDGDNTIQLGNSSIQYLKSYATLSTGSDRRLKKNIEQSDLGLDFILKLNPVSYEMREGHEGVRYTGFIAQEVETVVTEMGEEFSGLCRPRNESEMYSLRYATFTVPLVNAVQEQQEMIDDLQAENDALKAQLDLINQRLEALEQN